MVDYPFPEVVEAFRYASTQTGGAKTGEEFMLPWFVTRYVSQDDQRVKFRIFMSIMDYLAEYRDVLDDAHLNVSCSDESGDLVHGIVVRLLLGHFVQTRDKPKPEQLIERARQLIEERRACDSI